MVVDPERAVRGQIPVHAVGEPEPKGYWDPATGFWISTEDDFEPVHNAVSLRSWVTGIFLFVASALLIWGGLVLFTAANLVSILKFFGLVS